MTSHAPDAPDMGEIEEVYTGTGPEVVVLGDSVTAISRPWVREALRGHALKIGALWGEGFGGGPISAAVGRRIMQETARTYGADRPSVAVVELGTNDCWHDDLTLEGALEGLRSILASLEGARVVGVTITEISPVDGYDNEGAGVINEAIRAAADVVVEWGPISVSDRYLDPADRIHPSLEGSKLFASMMADGVARALELT
jgi:lysophospholipase L1-like esterase